MTQLFPESDPFFFQGVNTELCCVSNETVLSAVQNNDSALQIYIYTLCFALAVTVMLYNHIAGIIFALRACVTNIAALYTLTAGEDFEILTDIRIDRNSRTHIVKYYSNPSCCMLVDVIRPHSLALYANEQLYRGGICARVCQ